jgi:hypothetical protein
LGNDDIDNKKNIKKKNIFGAFNEKQQNKIFSSLFGMLFCFSVLRNIFTFNLFQGMFDDDELDIVYYPCVNEDYFMEFCELLMKCNWVEASFRGSRTFFKGFLWEELKIN